LIAKKILQGVVDGLENQMHLKRLNLAKFAWKHKKWSRLVVGCPSRAAVRTGLDQVFQGGPQATFETGIDWFWNWPEPILAVRDAFFETIMIMWKICKLCVEKVFN
jgi:hypothetical protein